MESLLEIKKKLRLSMDGANASSMRKKGIEYKLNFGVSIITLRKIAQQYYSDAFLAENLWKENIREMKILASLIYPPESFTMADEWVNDVDNIELAEQLCMNLFCKMPEAEKNAYRWIFSEKLYTKISGFLLYGRLFMNEKHLEPDKDIYISKALDALFQDSLLLRNAVLLSLKRYGRRSLEISDEILFSFKNRFAEFTDEQQAMYDDLKFEFDYYLS